ncbi:MAG: MCE family protein [Rhodocyclaceae bacterium]|jgi:phospholipid/cholesterol/gamma-HCH transport system substrate-binding protein|nr:MCE family protein [Rhodocyclaceae bacterium]
MENRAHALAAGIFTLLLGLAIAATVFWFSGKREATNEYILVSKGNISGLNTQAQVRFRGIRAGKVQDIELDPKDPRSILISISVAADLPITRGTTARLHHQGVTGLASILLEDKGDKPEPLTSADGEPPRIALLPGFMDTLSDNAAELMKQMHLVAERTTVLLSEQNVKRIGQTLANVETATAGLSGSMQDLPQLMASLKKALSDDNLKRLSATLANMEKASGEAAPLIANLQGVAKKLDVLLGESGGEIAQTTLPRLNALLQELAVNSRQMTRLLDQLEESPSMLVFGRGAPRPGPGEAGFPVQ